MGASLQPLVLYLLCLIVRLCCRKEREFCVRWCVDAVFRLLGVFHDFLYGVFFFLVCPIGSVDFITVAQAKPHGMSEEINRRRGRSRVMMACIRCFPIIIPTVAS